MKSQFAKFWCGFCGRAFQNSRKLARHSKNQHGDSKLLIIRENDNICPHCDLHMPHSKFQTFISHITTCILNRKRSPPGTFQCRTCNQSFRRRDNLLRHKLRFHSAKALSPAIELEEPSSPRSDPNFDKYCYDVISGAIDPNLLVEKKSTSVKQIRQLKAKGTTTTFRFTKLFKSLSKYGYFLDVLEIVFGHLISDLDLRQPNVFVNLCLDSDDQLSYPIKTPLMKSQEFDLSLFLMSVEAVCQSRTALGMDGDITLEVTTCVDPTAVVGRKLVSSKIAYFSEFLLRKSGVLDPTPIQNALLEEACVAVCLAAYLYSAFISKNPKFSFKRLMGKKCLPNKAYSYVKQFYDVLELPYASAIQLNEEKMDKIQKWLSEKYNTKLLVHNIDLVDLKQINLLYSGPTAERTVHLLLYDSHCYLVTNQKMLFGGYNFCQECELVHQKGKCIKKPICHLCHGNDCHMKTGNSNARTIFCDDCSKWFKDRFCFDQHISLNTCDVEKRCLNCGRIIKAALEFRHHCGMRFCYVCKLLVPQNDHGCYIQTEEIKPTNEKQLYIFADLESRIDPESQIHFVVLAYAVRVCERCIHDWDYSAVLPCCGNREFSFFGETALGDFVKWLAYNEMNAGAICFCHYGGGYDFILMLEEILRLRHRPKKMITRNLRIISMVIGQNVKCRDSFNLFRYARLQIAKINFSLFSCALRKLPKLFGLDAKKEWFPFEFLSRKPLDYVGKWPEIKDFWVKKEETSDFMKFLNATKAKYPVFSLKNSLIGYCKKDVYVLHQACSRFYQLLFNTEGINPLLSLSISSLTARIYRARYLESSEQIAVIYDCNNAAVWSKMQSEMAYRYLSYLHARFPSYSDLKFAGNSARELRIGGMLADGVCAKSRTIIEVNSCFHHAHLDKSCLYYRVGKESEKHPLYKPMTYEDVFQQKTQFKADHIEKKNWKLETIWTCSIEKQLKSDDDLATFFTDYDKAIEIQEPINGRSALFGGRTGTNHLLVAIDEKMVKDGWAIEYIDIVSLYPYVMSTNEFPVSHPVIKNHYDFHKNGYGYSKDGLGSCLGIYKCTVLFDLENNSPPVFPVLPTKVCEKLVFAICSACASACDNNLDCKHTAEERTLKGCWTNVELIRAIEQGFEIRRIHQAWLFEHSSRTLFEKYMKTYATLKYKAGFPATVTTQDEKSSFLGTLHRGMGIDLAVDDVDENPALKSFAKSILVNLWGKLGESCEKNGSRCNFVETTEDLSKLINDRSVEITNIKILTDKHLLVETKTKQEFYTPNQFHNPVISSFVTAYGRLYLLDTLERLGNQVLYYDTDSCIFLYQKGGAKPKTGELFGEFKSELQAGEYGIKFLSLAPKMYALLTNEGRLIFRAKGLSLDESLGKHLKKFDVLTAILLQNSDDLQCFYDALEDKELGARLKEEHRKRNRADVGLVLPDPLIVRNWKKNEPIHNDSARTKNLRLTFSKRRICSRPECLAYPPIMMTSHPWGFSHQ